MTLDQLARFLGAAGVLVIWLGPKERMLNRTLRLALERLGFRIGVRDLLRERRGRLRATARVVPGRRGRVRQ
jgi:hypothetical protein